MIHLTLITVGDLPKGSFQQLGDEYKKRLTPYVKLTHKIVDTEEKIKKQIPDGDLVIVLDEKGQLATSVQAAQMVKRVEEEGRHVTVILGGPKGLSNETKAAVNVRLSLSPMTTTHDLAHIFFLEQLYRIMTIIRGKEYHY